MGAFQVTADREVPSVLRLLYLFASYVPTFDEGIGPLFRMKNEILRRHYGVQGPVLVARHAITCRPHAYSGCFLEIG